MEASYSLQNGNGRAINGRGLRRRRMGRNECIQLAADLASGRPYTPSIQQAATIMGVPARLVGQELKARTTTQEKPAEIETSMERTARLGFAWLAASVEEREDFVREVGVDAVWDVIARLIR